MFIWDFSCKGSRSNYKNLLLFYTLKNYHIVQESKGNYILDLIKKKSRNKLRDLYSWQSEHWWRQLKMIQKKWKDIPVHELEEVILLNYPYYSKQSTDLMQSLLKYPEYIAYLSQKCNK